MFAAPFKKKTEDEEEKNKKKCKALSKSYVDVVSAENMWWDAQEVTGTKWPDRQRNPLKEILLQVKQTISLI